MKIERGLSYIDFNFNKGYIKVSCEWLEWIFRKHFHWINFHLITVEFEYDKAGPQVEFTVALLGFYIYTSWGLPWVTEESKSLRDSVSELDKELDNANRADPGVPKEAEVHD